jgi:hypothetical protein
MSKKTIFLLVVLLVLLWVVNVSADTIPGGDVYGTWYQANSPYYITGSITVPSGDTLTIEPGVEVNFQGIYTLTVNGMLEAVGTETDSIHFLPTDTSTFWAGMRFDDAPDSSHLAFCTVSHVGHWLYELGGIICTNSNPVITHCRISDNIARLAGSNFAGGITLINSHPEISGCNIINNEGGMVSAGIYLVNSSPVITGCSISNNEGQYLGGGVSITGNSMPIIKNCTIEKNLSNNGYGGGIYSEGGLVTISECTFNHNEAFDEGGGISIHAGSVFLDHCIFEFNQCMFGGRMEGGGVYTSGGTLTVDHCTFYRNFVNPIDHNGLDIHITGSAAATVTNSIFFDEWFLISFGSTVPPSVSYNDFQVDYPPNYFIGSVPPGLGALTQVNYNGNSCDVYSNIYLDPLFVDYANADYHLQAGSPCIDAGDPNSPKDPDSSISDIGALYYHYLRGDANQDKKVTIADIVFLVSYLFKHGPAPAPLKSGDANCDGKVTVADVVYLVAYLFKHGPQPAC